MTTHLLSADHRLPGLDIAARFGAVAPRLGPDLLEAVPALRGALVLSTCNRLTLLIDADFWVDTGCPAALHPGLRPADVSRSVAASSLGETITAFLAERAELPVSGPLLIHLVGAATRRETFAIAAGLSSMVVGEAQIIGQVRRAVKTVAAEGTFSPELVRVIERASTTAHRVTHETELSGQGRSVVVVGVDQAAGHPPPLEDCRALIVGTGSYAGVTVADLRARGLTDIAIYSASNHAEAFVAGHGLRAVLAGALSETVSCADLVVTCRGTGGPILTADIVAPVAAERTDSVEGVGRPLVILDLALTRDVNEAVGALPGIVHLDLARVRDTVPDAETQQVTAARATVEAEAADFERTLVGRAVDPLIIALHVQAGHAVAKEATRLRPQPAHRFTLAVPAVNGRAGTGVNGVNSVNAVAGTCLHHHLAADPGFEAASGIGGEPMVPLAQAERALHHLAARLLHQPIVMVCRAGQEGCEKAYRRALELVWGLESTEENHD